MAVYEASRHGPKIMNCFTGILEVSHEVVEETLQILQESQQYSLLELVDAGSKWMFSNLDPKGLIRPSPIAKNKFSFIFGKYHLFRIESFRVYF